MTSLAEQSIRPFLSAAARDSETYNEAMRSFYGGVCGTYPAMLTDIVAAATRHAPTLALEFRILAREELCGARIIARAADAVDGDSELREAMGRHAQDEGRHSRMFHALVEHALPGITAMPLPDTDAEEELGPDFSDVEGFLISIHLAELRAQLIVSAFKQQIDIIQPEGHRRMSRILDAVLADEAQHIHYTSERVADWIARDKTSLEKLEHYIPVYDGYWWVYVETLSASLAKSSA